MERQAQRISIETRTPLKVVMTAGRSDEAFPADFSSNCCGKIKSGLESGEAILRHVNRQKDSP
jgi:hypothetical protein